MTVVAISGVRDEEDVIESSIGYLVRTGQVDHAIVSVQSLSTDATFDLLSAMPHTTVLVDDDPAHHQSEKMTALAQRALAEFGPDSWVIPVDGDEVWYAPGDETIRERLDRIDRHQVLTALMYDHVPTALDPTEGSTVQRIGWRRRNPAPMVKVAARVAPDLVIEDGNHGVRYTARSRFRARTLRHQLVIRHFPYRSAEQFVRKAKNGAAALKLTDRPEHIGKHWRDYAALAEAQGDDVLASVFYEHFHGGDDPRGRPDLIFDPAPSAG